MIAISLLTIFFNASPFGVGAELWSLDSAAIRARATLNPGFAWSCPDGGTSACLSGVSTATDPAKGAGANFPMDLEPWRGAEVELDLEVRADSLSKPAASFLGVKAMIHYTSELDGEAWPQPSMPSGDFGWTPVRFLVHIPPDAEHGSLFLGLQGASGRVAFRKVRIVGKRGMSVLHRVGEKPWHTEWRGVMSPPHPSEKDFADLEGWHANLVRLQMNIWHDKSWFPDTDLVRYSAWVDSDISEIRTASLQASKHGIGLVVDLHQPPGGSLKDGTYRVFLDKRTQDAWLDAWRRIATASRSLPGIAAYDLMNEPTQKLPSPDGVLDWWHLARKAAAMVRAIDPKTPIIVSAGGGGDVHRLTEMGTLDVPGVIYTFHMYYPSKFTSQGLHASWDTLKYPGTFQGKPLNKETLRKELSAAREFQLATGARIYVGEFSALRWAPGASRYLADCISLFEEYGWDWSYHAFREYQGWDLEMEDLPRKEPALHATSPTDRLQVLLDAFRENRPLGPNPVAP